MAIVDNLWKLSLITCWITTVKAMHRMKTKRVMSFTHRAITIYINYTINVRDSVEDNVEENAREDELNVNLWDEDISLDPVLEGSYMIHMKNHYCY